MPKFNLFYDPYFWTFFAVIVTACRLCGANPRIRSAILLVSSLLMVLALPGFTVASLSFLLGIGLLTLALGYLLNGNSLANRNCERIALASIAVVFLVGVLVFFKYRAVQGMVYEHLFYRGKDPSAPYIIIIGMSYFAFKMIHFVLECYRREIKRVQILHFLNYIFFFPAFVSGPINRYNHFTQQVELKSGNGLGRDLRLGAERVIHGLFKKIVLCTILFPYTLTNLGKSAAEGSASEIILGAYAFTLYVYFDFAGYSDIAVGCARMMGIGLPENFERPFLRRNIQQLWTNWHISLTSWLTDYIYWPLVKKLRADAFFRERPVLLSNVAIIVTFVVCGLWHGESLNFVLWGAYHGVGLAVLKTYQQGKRRVRNRVVRDYFSSRYSQWVGILGTFNFFVVGILLFLFDIKDLRALLLRIF